MKRSIVYTAIGFSILLPGLATRAMAQIPAAETNTAPAAASVNGLDYVVWKGHNTPGSVWYATSSNNGGNWSSQQAITFAKTTQAPALAKYYLKGGISTVEDSAVTNPGWWRHDSSKYFGQNALRAGLASLLGISWGAQ